VSAGSFGKLIRKVLSAVPGLKPAGSGRFFYPRKGFGQISEAYADAALKLGADFWLGWKVARLDPPTEARSSWQVHAERNGETRTIAGDYVWSTIPISLLARTMSSGVPESVKEASGSIDYRSMLLIYLELDVDHFTEYDAHYFPAAGIRITRLSEPKNYAALTEPRGSTTLCAELPCSPNDAWWTMNDQELGALVAEDLAHAGIPLSRPPVAVHTRRLRQAYPIYTRGYEGPFGLLDRWVDQLPNLLSYGRQGLFAHDNTHHALYMAYCAVDCLAPDGFDNQRWARYREIFATHVVED
jgi:protoporphyrinogen oxidase